MMHSQISAPELQSPVTQGPIGTQYGLGNTATCDSASLHALGHLFLHCDEEQDVIKDHADECHLHTGRAQSLVARASLNLCGLARSGVACFIKGASLVAPLKSMGSRSKA